MSLADDIKTVEDFACRTPGCGKVELCPLCAALSRVIDAARRTDVAYERMVMALDDLKTQRATIEAAAEDYHRLSDLADRYRTEIGTLRAEVEELKRQLGLANQALEGMRERDSRHRAEVARLTRERDEARKNWRVISKAHTEQERMLEEAERDAAQLEVELRQAEARAEDYHRSLTESMKVIHEEQARAERLRSESEHLCNLIERYADDEHDGWLGMDVRSQIERVRAALSEEGR